MKKIGILGGMSPESTTLYYEQITRNYTEQYGDYGYPEILIYSVNFQKFVDWQRNGKWHEAAREMATALERLDRTCVMPVLTSSLYFWRILSEKIISSCILIFSNGSLITQTRKLWIDRND